jgi:RNA polymerase sigma-70 factor (ECF subfamily)
VRPSSTLEPVALSDGQLIAEASTGNIDAFAALYDRYGERAYRVAASVAHDNDYAQEAVQEAFLSIWRNAASYQSQRGSAAAWVLSIVRHRAIDLTRRNRPVSDPLVSDTWLRQRPAPEDVCEQTLARERAERLRALLHQLPDTQREVITLAFYGQLSHTEIAEHLGLPAGTVKGRMRLGMHKLRAHLEPRTL